MARADDEERIADKLAGLGAGRKEEARNETEEEEVGNEEEEEWNEEVLVPEAMNGGVKSKAACVSPKTEEKQEQNRRDKKNQKGKKAR